MRKAAVLSIVLMLMVPGAVAAQQEEPPEGAMLIILDASGSMNNVDETGVAYIDKAKAAILELVRALPDEMQVGLRVYGHREPNTDRARGCLDTELVAPIAPLDLAAIEDAIAGVQASGFTPIGLSLQEAAADLPELGPRSIILISDGEDTCAPPDPCQIAEELFGNLLDVRIESVGFLVGTGSAAEQQLRCIADVTGGEYRSVDVAGELVARLGEVTDDLLEWRPPLTLNGALDHAAAMPVPLTPKADWATDEPGKIAVQHFTGIIMPGETRWYQLDLWERESAWVWSDLEWPEGLEAGGHFETVILDEAGNRVEANVGHGGYPLRIELPGSESPMIGAAIEGPRQGWPAQASYLVGLHWDAPSRVFLGSLHVAVEVLSADPNRYQDRSEIEGSLNPAAAPTLPLTGLAENGPDWRGGEYRGPLASGETRWYRLDLDRGEVINAFALFPGDRHVGEGMAGEFSIVLTDDAGNAVGSPFDEWPQLTQRFGGERHQATVSGTTSYGEDPLPETVLVGLEWDGPAGQTSEVRFEVEAVFDQGRKDAADRIEAESGSGAGPEETPSPPSDAQMTTTTLQTAGERVPADEDSSLGMLLIAGVLLIVGTAAALTMRARRR